MSEIVKDKMFEQKFLRKQANTVLQKSIKKSPVKKTSTKLIDFDDESAKSQTKSPKERHETAIDRLLPSI